MPSATGSRNLFRCWLIAFAMFTVRGVNKIGVVHVLPLRSEIQFFTWYNPFMCGTRVKSVITQTIRVILWNKLHSIITDAEPIRMAWLLSFLEESENSGFCPCLSLMMVSWCSANWRHLLRGTSHYIRLGSRKFASYSCTEGCGNFVCSYPSLCLDLCSKGYYKVKGWA